MDFIKKLIYTVLLSGIVVFGIIDLGVGFKLYDYARAQHRYARAYEIYRNIELIAGTQKVPPLLVLDSDEINAWFDGEKVTITTALIDLIKTDDGIALILGHELSHALQLHMLLQGAQDSRDMEANADRMGAFFMLRAGYDICAGRDTYLVFLHNFGEDPTEATHPTHLYRYNLMSMPWCSQVGE